HIVSEERAALVEEAVTDAIAKVVGATELAIVGDGIDIGVGVARESDRSVAAAGIDEAVRQLARRVVQVIAGDLTRRIHSLGEGVGRTGRVEDRVDAVVVEEAVGDVAGVGEIAADTSAGIDAGRDSGGRSRGVERGERAAGIPEAMRAAGIVEIAGGETGSP